MTKNGIVHSELLSKNLVCLMLSLQQWFFILPVVFLSSIVLLKPDICFATESVAYIFIVPKIVSRKHIIHVALYFLHSWKKQDGRKILLL